MGKVLYGRRGDPSNVRKLMTRAQMEHDPPFYVIFTDLDGTLLDHITYGWDEAKAALDLCKRLHIPIVMVSSKTRAEMDVIRKKLEFPFPFVSENGGGIFFPKEAINEIPPATIFAENMWRWSLGLAYEFLVKCLREIRDELGWHIRGLSEMTPEEISSRTGLDLESSRLAAKREYDEPFIVLEQEKIDIDTLRCAAQRRGLTISTGGRFYHLHGQNDKGEAVERVIMWYKEHHSQIITIALGDSPNDFSMLKRVNHPVLIRSSNYFSGIEESIPGLMVTQEMGPKGWNSAVLRIIREKM
ncbi:MAG: HAD-IIB family hydrolase [Desulfobacteraceae bacterium]|nr:HAD-IIB family hydrolase [Desulfobacteraceae bacterium]